MTNLYWINGPWPGKLAIIARPRGGEWLATDVAIWQRNQIDLVVSLLTASEAMALDLQQEQQVTEKAGIAFRSLPIPDRGVPPSTVAAQQLIETLAQQLHLGRTVALHCRHGIGRSAIMAAALLVQSGMAPTLALRQVEMARGRPVPDTEEQTRWVERFAMAEALPLWA